jgi:hypothetical protein
MRNTVDFVPAAETSSMPSRPVVSMFPEEEKNI